MPSAITNDIHVQVDTQYQPQQSRPLDDEYLFAYRISIENKSDYVIQLMKRHWYIFDSNGDRREVEGEGVVGIQPILKPGEAHSYISACNLHTDMGKMKGFYTFERLEDGFMFEVEIPEFTMIMPVRLS